MPIVVPLVSKWPKEGNHGVDALVGNGKQRFTLSRSPGDREIGASLADRVWAPILTAQEFMI